MSDVAELAKDAPAAMPELKDIDAADAGQIAAAAYGLVRAVMVAIAA
jgi:hypothetical protein